jgi:hypothetical protein
VSIVTKTLSPRELRIAIALTPLLFFLVIGGIAVTEQVWRADFAVPYTGGLILRHGNARNLYNVQEQEQAQRAWLERGDLLLDPYPPFHAVLFAPLTHLGYRAAYLVWGVFNILLWVWFRHLFTRHVATTIEPYRYLQACALFFPVATTLIQGQFSLLLLIAFTLCFVCLRRKREYAAGLALGLGLLKFQVILPFALILGLRRKWRVIAGLTAAVAIVLVASAATTGTSNLWSYAQLLIDTMSHPENPAYSRINAGNMPTVNGLVACVLGRSVPRVWSTGFYAVLSGALILFTAWEWDRQGDRDGDGFALVFAAALVVSLVTAPYLLIHDVTPALLAVLLVGGSPRWSRGSRECLALTIAISVLYGMPVYYGFLLRWHLIYLLAPILLGFAVAAILLARKPVCEKPAQSSLGEPSSARTDLVGVTG